MGVTVTRDVVRHFSALVLTIFADALALRPGMWRELATVVQSTQASEEYAWLSQVPVMREFIDERKITALGEYGFALKNKKWESTIGFEREVLEDDQTGNVRVRIMQMVEQAYAHYDKLIFELIASGENNLAYDGAPFYGEHATGGTTYTNLDVLALTAENLETAVSQMMRIPLDNGEPAMVKPTHLLVPPELWWTAKRLVNSAMTPDANAAGGAGQSAINPLFGELIPVASPRLTSATEWHLLDNSHPIRPFFLQQRIAPEMQALDGTDGTTETDFMRDIYVYGVRARHNAGYGLPHFAFKSTGAG
ncbi:MAG: Mu-like prophage major head subunit gpT family protein [Akkermansiaceae bacterium]|nr:Mu-like prophage major head subunit gpT family protein [Armatimonadota bacterium]